MKCANCGEQLESDAEFCMNCGIKIPDFISSELKEKGNKSDTTEEFSTCLLCGSEEGFVEERGRIETKWGMSHHMVKLYICVSCNFVHTFLE